MTHIYNNVTEKPKIPLGVVVHALNPLILAPQRQRHVALSSAGALVGFPHSYG